MLEVVPTTKADTVPPAPAERSTDSEIGEQVRYFLDNPRFAQLYDTVPDIVMVLNRNRQIVFGNAALHALLGLPRDQFRGGQRPGEILRCTHAFDGDGCGTTEFCSTCGAVQAIMGGLAGRVTAQECRIVRDDGDPLDLYVWASPLSEDDSQYSVVVIKDISDQKRRQALEKVFFHDVLNVVNNILLSANLLNEGLAPGSEQQLVQMLVRYSQQLIGEIDAQRSLADAENNELVVHLGPVSTRTVMENVARFYEIIDSRKTITIDAAAEDLTLISDGVLLQRILGNMVKNALEASEPGETITINCSSSHQGMVELSVHNPAVMPKRVQLQVFQRSFSTKGSGRGLGTFSIKLLSERYLGGSVSFTSSKNKGTTFRAVYPLSLG